jgi:hypothetical protein
MTTVRLLASWKVPARLCRLETPRRWTEKIGSKTVRRSASFVIVTPSFQYPANRYAQIVGDPIAA